MVAIHTTGATVHSRNSTTIAYSTLGCIQRASLRLIGSAPCDCPSPPAPSPFLGEGVLCVAMVARSQRERATIATSFPSPPGGEGVGGGVLTQRACAKP